MLFWLTNISSRPLLAVPIFTILCNPAFSQNSQGINQEPAANAVTCYKSVIKEPLTFYGNPMDAFMFYDGTRWKVLNGGAYEYTPIRYRNVLICPSEKLLVVDKRAISVSKINQ